MTASDFTRNYVSPFLAQCLLKSKLTPSFWYVFSYFLMKNYLINLKFNLNPGRFFSELRISVKSHKHDMCHDPGTGNETDMKLEPQTNIRIKMVTSKIWQWLQCSKLQGFVKLFICHWIQSSLKPDSGRIRHNFLNFLFIHPLCYETLSP